MKFCPYCGNENPADYNYCSQCQKLLPKNDLDIKPHVQQHNSPPPPPPMQFHEPEPAQHQSQSHHYQQPIQEKWQLEAVKQDLYVNLSPHEVINRANRITSNFNMEIQTSSPTTLTAEGNRDYTVWVLVLLVIFTLIGGAIYYFSRKRNRYAIYIQSSGTGSNLQMYTQGRIAKACIDSFIATLR